MPTNRSCQALGAALVATLLAASVPALADGEASLSSLERDVAEKYRSLSHVHPEQLIRRSEDEPVVLFDVRDLIEHRVAHVTGSYHVDPGITTEEFLARFAETIKGKHVLFYCSVGHRSSAFASRLAGALIAREAASVANPDHASDLSKTRLAVAQGAEIA